MRVTHIGPSLDGSGPRLPLPGRRWRESYNPLRGLTLARLAAMLEASQRGDGADLQWFYRFVERRFPVLRACIARRRAALAKLRWRVTTPANLPPGATPAQAAAQQAWLSAFYLRITNLEEAVRHLALAEFRGWAVLAKHRVSAGPDAGDIQELHWLPPWNLLRDGWTGDFYWNPDARAGVTPESLGAAARMDPSQLVVRECDLPINEIAAVAFVRSSLALKDWSAFVEMYGLPGAIAILPPNVPPDQAESFRAAAEQVAEGGCGALPHGSDVKFPTAALRGDPPFRALLDWDEKDVVLAATGGKLSMLNDPTGIGGAQAQVHQAAFDDLAFDEAQDIAGCLHRQLTVPELAARFPGQPVCVRWVLGLPTPPTHGGAIGKTEF